MRVCFRANRLTCPHSIEYEPIEPICSGKKNNNQNVPCQQRPSDVMATCGEAAGAAQTVRARVCAHVRVCVCARACASSLTRRCLLLRRPEQDGAQRDAKPASLVRCSTIRLIEAGAHGDVTVYV